MKKVCIFLLLSGTLSLYKGYSQYLPPSPNAISAVSSSSLYTGKISESIPLANLNSKQLSVPISLTYNGGGIKLEEIASSVGLGWNLSVGGVITRSVKGRPDDDPNGYLYKGVNIPLVTSQNDQNIKNLYIPFNNFTYDGEADFFYFNFNGRGGAFFFDKNKNTYFVPDQKLKLAVAYSGTTITKFIITDEEGVKYTFDQTEVCTTLSQTWSDPTSRNFTYNSAWYLSKIESPDALDIITFSYITIDYDITLYNRDVFYFQNDNANNSPSENVYSDIHYTTKYLSTISSSTFKAQMTYTSDRKDLSYVAGASTRPKSLDKIQLYNKNSGADVFVKEFDFSYTYANDEITGIPEGSATGGVTANRLILESLTEKNGATASKPYSFKYYWTNYLGQARLLPDRYSSHSLDHWGFCNGATNFFLMPKTIVYPDYAPNGLDPDYFNAVRTVDTSFAKSGSLIKVTYPTGGSKSISYEINCYKNPAGVNVYGGGIRIKSVILDDDNGTLNTISYNYNEPANPVNTSGYIISPIRYDVGRTVINDISYVMASATSCYPLTSTQGSYVGYEYVTVSDNHTGETQYRYHTPNDYPDKYELHVMGDENFYYQEYTSPTTPMGIAPSLIVNEDWRRGSLKSVLKTDLNGNMVSKTVYTYTDIEPGYTNNTICYVEDSYMYPITKHYRNRTNYLRRISSVTETLYDQANNNFMSSSNTSYSYDNTAHFYPTRVTSDNGKGGKTVTKTKYVADYNNGATDCIAGMTITNLKQKNMISIPLEQQVWESELTGNSYNLISGNYTYYCEYFNNYRPQKTYSLELNTPLTSAQFGESYTYSGPYTSLMPNSTYYKEKIGFVRYDTDKHLLESKAKDGKTNSTLYGYNNAYPIARIENGAWDRSFYSSFEYDDMGRFVYDVSQCGTTYYRTGAKSYNLISGKNITATVVAGTYKLECWTYGTATLNVTGAASTVVVSNSLTINNWKLREYLVTFSAAGTQTLSVSSGNLYIDDLRLYPNEALITSYTYTTIGQVSSVTDINNITIYNTYDALGRLITVKDEKGNLLEKYDYNQK